MIQKKEPNEYWKQYLGKMPKDDLLYVACNQDDYSPELYAMVMELLWEKYGVTRQYVNSILNIDQYFEGELGTRDMLLDLIRKMGCRQSIDFLRDDSEAGDWFEEKEDDGNCDFGFTWQNNYYYVNALNDRSYVYIDLKCENYYWLNEEKKTRIKETINELNVNYAITTLYYTTDDSLDNISVYCRSSFLFVPLINDLDLYFISHLKFLAKRKQQINDALKEVKEWSDEQIRNGYLGD